MADLNAFAHRHAGVQNAVVAHRCVPADGDVWMHDRARADARLIANDRERTDRHVGSKRDPIAHQRQAVHTLWGPPGIDEELDGVREGQIGVLRAEHRARRRFGRVTQNDG